MKFNYDLLREKLRNASYEQTQNISISYEDMCKVLRNERHFEAEEILNLSEALNIKGQEFTDCFFTLMS